MLILSSCYLNVQLEPLHNFDLDINIQHEKYSIWNILCCFCVSRLKMTAIVAISLSDFRLVMKFCIWLFYGDRRKTRNNNPNYYWVFSAVSSNFHFLFLGFPCKIVKGAMDLNQVMLSVHTLFSTSNNYDGYVKMSTLFIPALLE